MASGMMQIPLGDGYSVCVCLEHAQEFCHKCGYAFTEMNEITREKYAMHKACKKPMKKGLLPKGTMVRMKDHSENNNDFSSRIVGTMKGDPWDVGDLQPCYVLEAKKDKDQFLMPIDEVHEEFILEEMTFDQVKSVVLAAEEGGDEAADDDDEDDDDSDDEDSDDNRKSDNDISSWFKAGVML